MDLKCSGYAGLGHDAPPGPCKTNGQANPIVRNDELHMLDSNL